MVIMSGISQIGGKFRLRKRLLEFTPYHEFFLSMFLGAGHFEVNKPRCRYECFNDAESDIINYFLQIRKHHEEFDEMKQGVFGLVSQEICNRIVNGKIQPKNDLEKAYFFYYLNKLTFGGTIWKVRKKPPWKGMTVNNLSKGDIEEIKTKGYGGLNQNRAIPQSTFHKEDIEKIKEEFEIKTKGFRGITTKAGYRGVILPTVCKEKSVNDAKAQFNSAYKGINPKTTRPYKNNDCGLLSPIDPEAIKRLRYVNLTTYDFRKVYKMFYEAFHVRKGLGRECFVYADPPYPGTEKYYGDLFTEKDHQYLIDISLESPFNFMQSIGGECDFYIDSYKDAGWIIEPVKVKYSTDANSQEESQEYICMNYNIKKFPKMVLDNQSNLMNYIEV